MAIHEKSLIDANRLLVNDNLVVDGVDVSGHWNTMILPRTLTEYDAQFEKTILQYAGGENVHRCWQCGSCTNSCTMYAQNTDFNPRYWIYLTRLGLKDEILKDKEIIWQCVSCNRCTNICPKDVRPEGVMKALAHWIEHEGLGDKSRSTIFDEEFTRQCLERGRIEDMEVLTGFFKQTNQAKGMVDMLRSVTWFRLLVFRMTKATDLFNGNVIRYITRTPIAASLHMGLAMFFKPRTKSWGRTGEVLAQYIKEQKELAHG
jgi:heterodisulfide reductase subunit C